MKSSLRTRRATAPDWAVAWVEGGRVRGLWGGRLAVLWLGSPGCAARDQTGGGPLAGSEAGPGVRFAAVAQSAVEAGRFSFIEAEQPVALVQQCVGAVGYRGHPLVLPVGSD